MKQLQMFFGIFLLGCQSTPTVTGFEPSKWNSPLKECHDSRLEQAQMLIDQQSQLLGCRQTQIKSLLGKPDEHELYLRTRNYFYYNLTPGDTCPNISKPLQLSILFNALDRAKEIMIIE